VNERDDNFPRSKRTTEAYLSVFKPLIWNVPLVIAFVVFALTTRPSFGDAVPVLILAALFVAMCIPVAIAASRLPALKRSEQQDKENLNRGLRPDGNPFS
jgi:heme O synthase-like polyprenyltransferase